MIVLYIILGIIVGVPIYLLLNMALMLVCRLFAGIGAFLWPWEEGGSAFMNEIEGGDGSLVESFGKLGKVIGLLAFILAVLYLVVGLIGRLVWLVYQAFRVWFKLIKFCWNLDSETKSKTETN